MIKRLKEAEARIAEIEKLREEKEKSRERIFKETSKLYAEQENKGIAGLDPLLKKLKITKNDLENFYDAQAKEIEKFAKDASSILKLNKKEYEVFQGEEKSYCLFPLAGMLFYHDWEACAYYALSCDCSPGSEMGNASASGFCVESRNELNLGVRASGVKNQHSLAGITGYCNFDMPAPKRTSEIHVQTAISIHGGYTVHPSTSNGSASFRMKIGLEAIQNGQTVANPEWTLVDYNQVPIIDRYDQTKIVGFSAPMAAEPFFIRVWAWLNANASYGGSYAGGEFSTGDQNYIRVLWVYAWTQPAQEMHPG